MHVCVCVCTRAHVCALMHTYTINSCMDSFPSTQFCELLNSTSDGCFPQFKHQHNERKRPLIQTFVCACVRARVFVLTCCVRASTPRSPPPHTHTPFDYWSYSYACAHAHMRPHTRTHQDQIPLVLLCRHLMRGRQPSDVELGARRTVGGRSIVGACVSA